LFDDLLREGESGEKRAARYQAFFPTIRDLAFPGGFMTTAVAVGTMKVAQVSAAGADFQIVEREIPKPGAAEVRIKVLACGVCHSDAMTKDGVWPGIQYPRVPGHEVAGVVDEVGAGVSEWKKGQRVGVGWHGGHDGTCLSCRRGDFGNCQNMKIPGISYDGGYQQYMVAPVEALVVLPDSLSDVEAAPLLCAGITTFNALRHSGALPSDLVAVQGIGGLGHLGIQFASKFGYNVAAIGRGPENEALAKKLGANVYIDSKATNAAEELQKLGGAKVILATAPSSKAMSEVINGLGPNGRLMVIGATADPIEVTPFQLISGSRTIQGWASGIPTDSEDTLRFAELTGVRAIIETYPLEKAAEAYARMMSGHAQFRVVLTM
jgi:D-arabinose 1-dehydrogenase-like Zn-dependent alcohol dehydrogenase